MTRPVIVELDACVHRFATRTVGPASFRVGPGVVHGLVGRQGAGKTTLVSLVTGRLTPTHGSVRVYGRQPRAEGEEAETAIGFSPDEDLVGALSSTGYWKLRAAVLARHGLDGRAALDSAAGLADRLAVVFSTRPGHNSGSGARRAAQVVGALMHSPPLIVLDEPTSGLDPVSAVTLGQILGEHAAAGAGIVIATPDLAWASRFTHTVSVVSAGSVALARPSAQALGSAPRAVLHDGFWAAAEAFVGELDTPEADSESPAG